MYTYAHISVFYLREPRKRHFQMSMDNDVCQNFSKNQCPRPFTTQIQIKEDFRESTPASPWPLAC